MIGFSPSLADKPCSMLPNSEAKPFPAEGAKGFCLMTSSSKQGFCNRAAPKELLFGLIPTCTHLANTSQHLHKSLRSVIAEPMDAAQHSLSFYYSPPPTAHEMLFFMILQLQAAVDFCWIAFFFLNPTTFFAKHNGKHQAFSRNLSEQRKFGTLLFANG